MFSTRHIKSLSTQEMHYDLQMDVGNYSEKEDHIRLLQTFKEIRAKLGSSLQSLAILSTLRLLLFIVFRNCIQKQAILFWFFTILELVLAFRNDAKNGQHFLTRLSVQGLCKLIDGWRNLETLVQQGSLPLKSDVLGPLNKPTEVTLGLNITT